MTLPPSLLVMSLPRSGSSACGKLLTESGFTQYNSQALESQQSSEFNAHGYFEDSGVNLCIDNLIRFMFTRDNSFLFNRGMLPYSASRSTSITAENEFFDLDESVVDIPKDYMNRLPYYTGHEWDVWGLTRMQEGGKWHKAYSRANVASYDEAKNFFNKSLKFLDDNPGYFIKDPRLVYVDELNFTELKVILINRDPSDVLKSMRNHYGRFLFTSEPIANGWVSNHFNYKVGPQEFSEFIDIYNCFVGKIKARREVFEISFTDLFDNTKLEKLSSFLNYNVSWK